MNKQTINDLVKKTLETFNPQKKEGDSTSLYRWTSVKNHIPTREERISWDKRGAILVASYNHYANERIIYISEDLTLYEEDEDVTHWMRLPKLPEIDNG